MNEWLKKEQFGMPRWIWLSLLGGGLALGLYLRSRAADAPPSDADAPGPDDSLYSAGESEGGLVGAGMIGPAPGAVTPVQTPFMPEGMVDVFGDLSAVTGALGDQLTEITTNRDEVTGGGPPSVPNDVHRQPPASEATPADDTGNANAQRQLQRVRQREQKLRSRVRTIDSQIRKARNRPGWGENPKLKQNVQRLRGERRQHINEIRSLASRRSRLVAKVG